MKSILTSRNLKASRFSDLIFGANSQFQVEISVWFSRNKMAGIKQMFDSWPKEKKEKFLRLIFNPKAFKNACSATLQPESQRKKVYECPKCGFEDLSLAEFRKIQTKDEKWNEAIMKWYQRKKCERQLKKMEENQREILFSKIDSFHALSQDLQKRIDAAKNDSFMTSTPVLEAEETSILREESGFVPRYYLSTIDEESDVNLAKSQASEEPAPIDGNPVESETIQDSEHINEDSNVNPATSRDSELMESGVNAPNLSISQDSRHIIEESDVNPGDSGTHEDSEPMESDAIQQASPIFQDSELNAEDSNEIPANLEDSDQSPGNSQEDSDANSETSIISQLREAPDMQPVIESPDYVSRAKMSRRTTIFRPQTPDLSDNDYIQGSSEQDRVPEQNVSAEIEMSQDIANPELQLSQDHQSVPNPDGTGQAITICRLSDDAKYVFIQL